MAKKRANGEGNIRKRKDGRWEGRYTAGYDEKTGKRLIKNVLGKTQAEVKEKLAKAVAEAESVDVRRADEYTLGTWLQTWYELYAKPHLRFSTAEYYRRGIELHITPRIGDIPLKKLTGRDLQWLYKELQEHGRLREAQKGKQPGLSDSTIRGIHTMLHNALDRAVKERLIVRNPADDCIPPKIPKHEMKILPPEQIKSYLTAADQRGVLPMFYLELISGLRKGELVALQWSDLDIENKTISVSKQAGRNSAGEPDITRPKTENSIRKISIPQDAVDLLVAEHQKHPGSPWMFPSPEDRRDVPPGLGGQHPQENPEGRGTGTPEISRLATHICDVGIAEWRGCENCIEYARPFRRRLYTEDIHPRHTADAGKCRGEDGQFYGASHVKKTKKKIESGGANDTIILSAALWTFRRVGHGVGQANSPPENPNK